jgi:hypothetical protein
MPLASVDAVQLTRIELVDCATAVTPDGMVGGVVSAGGGGGGGGGAGAGGGGAAELPPPPPHADNKTLSDTNAANARFRFMPIPELVLYAGSSVNLTPGAPERRRRARANGASQRKSHGRSEEAACRRAPGSTLQESMAEINSSIERMTVAALARMASKVLPGA